MATVTTLSSVSWDEALRGFLIHDKASDFSVKTIAFHRTQLTAFIAWANRSGLNLETFGKRHLDEYLAYRRDEGKAPKTIYHDATCIKVFLKWCVRNDIITRNCLAEYEIRTPARTAMYMPTQEDMGILLKVALEFWDTQKNAAVKRVASIKRSFHRDRNYSILMTLLDSACRISEVLDLKLDDYQKDEQKKTQQITITTSKGRKARVLPITPECADALADWLRIRARIMKQVPVGTDEHWIFMSETGNRLDSSSFCKVLHRYTKQAGLSEKITLHSLRRYSINRLVKINPRAAQYIAGHEDMKTTDLYSQIDAEHIRDVQQQAGVVRGIMHSKRTAKKPRLV